MAPGGDSRFPGADASAAKEIPPRWGLKGDFDPFFRRFTPAAKKLSPSARALGSRAFSFSEGLRRPAKELSSLRDLSKHVHGKRGHGAGLFDCIIGYCRLTIVIHGLTAEAKPCRPDGL